MLSIYLTDYSITNLHAFIQIFLIFCTKIKHPGCFFSWALPTPGLWNKDGGFWQYYKYRWDKDGDSSIPFRVRCPQTFLLLYAFVLGRLQYWLMAVKENEDAILERLLQSSESIRKD